MLSITKGLLERNHESGSMELQLQYRTKTKERRSDPTKKEGLTEEEKDSSHSRSLFMKKISVKTNWQKQGFFSKFEQ